MEEKFRLSNGVDYEYNADLADCVDKILMPLESFRED